VTLVNSVFICAFLIDGKPVAELFQTHNTFCWQHGQYIGSGIPTLKEANIECLTWLRNNTNLDISKIKTSSIRQQSQPVTGMSNYRENHKRRNKLPPIVLTMTNLSKNPKYKQTQC
jgi:hypothetical protein